MKFGLPPWLRRAKGATVEAARALVKYKPPPAAEPTDEETLNGWTPEALAEYRKEADDHAMAVVAASMEGRLRPRPRWANNRYRPLRWRG